ncbi:hypothetical protein D3C87_1769860 [compost metagenome]
MATQCLDERRFTGSHLTFEEPDARLRAKPQQRFGYICKLVEFFKTNNRGLSNHVAKIHNLEKPVTILCLPADHTFHSFRIDRPNSSFAFSSPSNCSFTGSHFSERPKPYAMLPILQTDAVRCPVSTSQIGGFLVRIAFRKSL